MLNHGLLFQVYGEGAAWQFLGWILVFTCLVLANEIARRTKAGGMLCFVVLPIILTVYFIAIYVSAALAAGTHGFQAVEGRSCWSYAPYLRQF